MGNAIHRAIRSLPLALALPFLCFCTLDAQEAPSFEPGPCPFEGGDWLEREDIACGTLAVPESRDRLEGRTLRLAVAILRSAAEEPLPDPVVFLSGGPGGAAVRFARNFAEGRLARAIREQRDFILWDQRGTGYSDPEFCPDLSAELLALDYGTLADDDAAATAVRLVSRCRERMLADGMDFSAYNSVSSARDLDDLRRALGYQRWNVFGASYGTRLALTAARVAPEGIRALILDSTSPPSIGGDDYIVENFHRSLDLVFQQCAADEACRKAFPDLEAEFYRTIADLNAEPVQVPMPDTARFPAGAIVLNGRTFALGVFQGLYSRNLIPLLPSAIRQLRARNIPLILGLAEALAPDPEVENPWLNYAVECYEQQPLLSGATASQIASRHPRLALIADATLGPACEAWHAERADTGLLLQPISSDVPALIAAGEFDPITPPRYGRLVAGHLPNSRYIEVRGMGHGTLPFTECTRGLMIAFLNDPTRELDTGCLVELPPITFITDIRIEPGIGALARAFAEGPDIGLILWIGITLLLLLSALLGWPVAALLRRSRRTARHPHPPGGVGRLARPLALLAALAAIGFVAGLALIVRGVAATNPFILGFGIPGSAAPLLWIPWLSLALTAGVIVLTVLAWRDGWWGRFARAHYTLVAAASASFAAFIITRGLL